MSTICAISTPSGSGGIAVARISGPEAFNIVSRIWHGKDLASAPSHTAHLGKIIDPDTAEPLDTAVATIFRAPASFTGQDVIELSVHGSPWIQRELINLLIRQGARMAQPGEFTRRALQNGKLDLAEAEAVADIIAANSRAAQRIAFSHLKGQYSARLEELRNQLINLAALTELELDFSEEDVEFADRTHLLALAQEIHTAVTALANSFAQGRALKEGVKVAIAGPTNAGKSTLLNRLLGEDRAIVSDIHGTTRDTIEDTIEINGILFRFIDTAGIRTTADPIEQIGIQRAQQAIQSADITLWLIDPQQPQLPPADLPHPITVLTKADLDPSPIQADITISALTDPTLTPLTDLLVARATPLGIAPAETVTNARHYQELTLAAEAIARTITALQDGTPTDLLAQDIRQTIHHLSSITTPITTPTLLTHIFSHFCIGK